MKKTFKLMAALVMGAGMMFSCQQAEEPTMDKAQEPVVETRAYGDKTPTVTIYVETNDVNPLNAGDYKLPDGTAYADIVEFFASNIHKRTVNGVVEPTLYLNDKMTNLLENGGAQKYVKGLQDKGIKVVLTVLGDWQGIGVANMNATQTTQFAKILAHAVEKYGLDGIGFDDEYSNYSSSLINGSFGSIITKLRNLMPAGKLITVFQWGNYGSSQINAAAGAQINHAYANFGYNTYIGISGVTKDRFAPLSINLGSIGSDVSYYGDKAYELAEAGYGSIMHFNLRTRSQADPLPLFKAIADGAWGETNVTCDNGNRSQDWTFVPSGYEITMDEVE
ncbi:glycoside hydrolase family 18 protein [Alistipes onderdonkii]|uniref:glycosyl hydrolase family 18 protein n=1 Tax=Alistipes onderdonkii TaxID=328813 RepID=UPI001D0BEA9E|nr:glycosyl hydrolase family 18 protein [Alistipes onderdonkii]